MAINFFEDISTLYSKISSDSLYSGNDSFVPSNKRGEGFERDFLVVLEILRSFLETLEDAAQANLVQHSIGKMLAAIPDNDTFYETPEGKKRYDTVILATSGYTDVTAISDFKITVRNRNISFHNSINSVEVPVSISDGRKVEILNTLNDTGNGIQSIRNTAIPTAQPLLVAELVNDKLSIKTTEAGRGSIIMIESISGKRFPSEFGISEGIYVPNEIAEKVSEIHLNGLGAYLGPKFNSYLTR